MHHPAGANKRLPFLRLPLPVLGLGRRLLPGASQSKDPAGHGRGTNTAPLHVKPRFQRHTSTVRPQTGRMYSPDVNPANPWVSKDTHTAGPPPSHPLDTVYFIPLRWRATRPRLVKGCVRF